DIVVARTAVKIFSGAARLHIGGDQRQTPASMRATAQGRKTTHNSPTCYPQNAFLRSLAKPPTAHYLVSPSRIDPIYSGLAENRNIKKKECRGARLTRYRQHLHSAAHVAAVRHGAQRTPPPHSLNDRE